jgi:hypothetical protein
MLAAGPFHLEWIWTRSGVRQVSTSSTFLRVDSGHVPRAFRPFCVHEDRNEMLRTKARNLRLTLLSATEADYRNDARVFQSIDRGPLRPPEGHAGAVDDTERQPLQVHHRGRQCCPRRPRVDHRGGDALRPTALFGRPRPFLSRCAFCRRHGSYRPS